MCATFLKGKQAKKLLNLMLVFENSRMDFKLADFEKSKDKQSLDTSMGVLKIILCN